MQKIKNSFQSKLINMYHIILLGRGNVGKSSIFNFLCSKKESKIRNEEGTTVDWRCKEIGNICIWDSPGYDLNTLEKFPVIPDEVYLVTENIILDYDRRLYRYVKSLFQKVLVVINKIDRGEDFDYSCFENFIKISIHSRYDLRKLKLIFISNLVSSTLYEKRKSWAIIGKPNVGKSSLINSLINCDRNKVENFEGTTKEILPVYTFDNIFIDTPGQRGRICIYDYEPKKIFGIIVVISTLIEKQDLKFLNAAVKNKKPVILFVNKIDLVKNKKEISTAFDKINQLFDVPIVLGSCLTRFGVHNVIHSILKMEKNYYKRIPTARLNEWISLEIKKKEPKIKFISQIEVGYPKFFIDCKLTLDKQKMLKRKISDDFDFKGIPIEIICK